MPWAKPPNGAACRCWVAPMLFFTSCLLLIGCRFIGWLLIEFNPMSTSLEIFGKTVRRFREGRGLSQEQLADLSNLHRTYIGGIERGERNVGLLNVVRIAKALNVLPSVLFKDFDKAAMNRLDEE